jgi:hypothetical protein
MYMLRVVFVQHELLNNSVCEAFVVSLLVGRHRHRKTALCTSTDEQWGAVQSSTSATESPGHLESSHVLFRVVPINERSCPASCLRHKYHRKHEAKLLSCYNLGENAFRDAGKLAARSIEKIW